MTRTLQRYGVLAAAVAIAVSACSSGKGATGNGSSSSGSSSAASGPASAAATNNSQFFNQAEFDKQLAERSVKPTGPADQPWLQAINAQMIDTSKFKKPPPWHVCFSNAGVGNPWRVAGLITLKQEVKLHPELSNFTITDAESKDDKQISDIDSLLTQKCDALIIDPNTTAALTPEVEKACQSGVPVIVFDRGVTTDCPTTFIHPIGGYAFGADAAEFLTHQLKPGAKVLALRILPGVDVLENRWAAANVIFKKAGIKVVGVEFTTGDPAKTKQIVSNYLQRYGHLDGVWMDAGATTVAAVEAFQDAGQTVPPIDGEDQNDWLKLWKQDNLNGFSSTYPVYQWRTAVLATIDILSGKQVPKEWILPEPKITKDNLDQYVATNMGPLFYGTCGCQKMPGFPNAWK